MITHQHRAASHLVPGGSGEPRLYPLKLPLLRRENGCEDIVEVPENVDTILIDSLKLLHLIQDL